MIYPGKQESIASTYSQYKVKDPPALQSIHINHCPGSVGKKAQISKVIQLTQNAASNEKSSTEKHCK
jgi:hypothetical protein